MCKEDRFCSNIGIEEKQLILLALNGASEVLPIDPKNEIMQEIYRALIAQGYLKLSQFGTLRGISLWPIKSELIIPARGQVHATLTMDGSMKLVSFTKGDEDVKDTEEE